MFDKLKQIKKLKALQNSLGEEQVEIEKNGLRVVINGKMEVMDIILNPELKKEEQERILKDCINEAMKKLQMRVAQKMSGLGF